MKWKSLLSATLALACTGMLLSGCGGAAGTSVKSEQEASAPAPAAVTEAAAEAPTPQEESAAEAESMAEPKESMEEAPWVVTEEPEELTMFVCIPDHIKQYINKMEDLDGFTEAEQLTNVQVSFSTASNETLADQFGLMVASGDYPDLCSNVTTNYGGGLNKALADEFIVDLTDEMTENAPDYLRFVSEDDEIHKSVVNDDGKYLAVYQVASDAVVSQGWVIRTDYLQQVGMEMPKTIADWEAVLTAFRDQLGLSDPMLLRPNLESIASAWGVADYMAEASNPMNYATWLYNEDGTVKSVFLEEGYQAFLEKLAQWYDTGLVNRDFVSRGGERDNAYKSVYYSGQAGIFYCNNLSDMGLENFEGEQVSLSPMPYPVLEEGDINQFGAKRDRIRNVSISVTTGCENVPLALRWLNFWFTEDGVKLANYGIEGKSWEYGSDGKWTYTDLVLNNPDGMSEFEARSLFSLADTMPTKLDPTRETTGYGDWEWDCVDTWANSSTAAYRIPSAVALDEEESETYNAYATDIETYAMENLLKFVTGEQDISSQYEEFQNVCRELGTEECIAAYQGAVTRFNNR